MQQVGADAKNDSSRAAAAPGDRRLFPADQKLPGDRTQRLILDMTRERPICYQKDDELPLSRAFAKNSHSGWLNEADVESTERGSRKGGPREVMHYDECGV